MREPRPALAAAVPGAADPARLDEAGLGGTAAGTSVPGPGISDLTSTIGTTGTRAGAFQDTVGPGTP